MNSLCILTPQSPKSPFLRHQSIANPNSFSNFTVLKQIDSGKFPIYLLQSKSNQMKYALKVFPYSNSRTCSHFENERKFTKFHHKNLIGFFATEDEYYIPRDGINTRNSCILMEFAPFKDFHNLIIEEQVQFDDILARTYFHQLINGLEYLHSQGVYHLDIKLDNLLVGKNFQLKIADFDISYINGAGEIVSRGTKDYRAPELARGHCFYPDAADVYSAAIVLFIFKSKGFVPYTEERNSKNVNLYSLMKTEDPRFWEYHCYLQKKNSSEFDCEFKELFMGMVKNNPKERLTIEQIKRSKWYNGPVYGDEELEEVLSNLTGSKLPSNPHYDEKTLIA